MKILNLGCGTKTSDGPGVVNIDLSIILRIKSSGLLSKIAPLILNGERLKKFNDLPENILVHDLSTGIPFDDDTVDVVYHSHVLEHLDRDVARKFLLEVKRVLRPGGIHRIVVPDFEYICRRYVAHIDACADDSKEAAKHDSFLGEAIEQSVRKEAAGTSHQKPVRRFLENLLLGDARKRTETHQWMYDKVNLKSLLEELGYSTASIQSFDRSLIGEWSSYGLDVDTFNNEYKPGSLYVEAVKKRLKANHSHAVVK
jgi:SAM-dependent methyltransferase